jgi:hypothetical protein
MHSFEVSLGYESVDRSTFSIHVENVVRSTLSYPNEISKEFIQFFNYIQFTPKFNIVKTKKEILYNGQQKRTTQKAILYIYICKSYEFESRPGDTTLCDKFCQRLVAGTWFSVHSVFLHQ